MLLLFLYYYSYRYPLQINSTGTSPTYSDTPLFWKSLKYFIFAPLFIYLGAQTHFRIVFSRKNRLVAYLLLFLLGCNIYYGFISVLMRGGEATIRIADLVMILTATLFCLSEKFSIDVEYLGKIFDVYFIYAVSYNLIQIFLYFSTGRLPALGYGTGVLMHVRFGGPYDDPNTWPMIMAFYFPYVMTRYKGFIKYFSVMICIVFTIMAWSGTGFIIFAASAFMMFILRFKDSKLVGIFLTIFIVATLILAFYYADILALIKTFSEMKSGSVQGHAASWTTAGLNPITLSGLFPYFADGESGFMRMLRGGGIPSILVFYTLMIIVIKRLSKLANFAASKNTKAVYYGMISYVISLALLMLNLPYNYALVHMGLFSIAVITACSKPERMRLQKI